MDRERARTDEASGSTWASAASRTKRLWSRLDRGWRATILGLLSVASVLAL